MDTTTRRPIKRPTMLGNLESKYRPSVHRALQELSDAETTTKTTEMETSLQKGLLVCDTEEKNI